MLLVHGKGFSSKKDTRETPGQLHGAFFSIQQLTCFHLYGVITSFCVSITNVLTAVTTVSVVATCSTSPWREAPINNTTLTSIVEILALRSKKRLSNMPYNREQLCDLHLIRWLILYHWMTELHFAHILAPIQFGPIRRNIRLAVHYPDVGHVGHWLQRKSNEETIRQHSPANEGSSRYPQWLQVALKSHHAGLREGWQL